MQFQKILKDNINHFGLNCDTIDFLTTVGLPIDFNDLQQAIEINFYFDNERIIKKEFNGITYVVIGDDSGANLGISLNDNKVFAVDFDNLLETNQICFLNSDIIKLVESMRCFIDLKIKSKTNQWTNEQLRDYMKAEFGIIDNNSISNDKNWWRQIMDDPILD